MKRLLSKYISAVLLLCLVIQVAPLSLLHSHEDHLTEVERDIHSMDHADHIDDTHHDSVENDCNVCKIQQSLNNQTFTLVEQVSIFNFTGRSSELLNLEASIDDHLIRNTSERGPPSA
ncbi:MAG: hypothetical protein ACI9XP_000865 [Lentimonas sp.]